MKIHYNIFSEVLFQHSIIQDNGVVPEHLMTLGKYGMTLSIYKSILLNQLPLGI